ARELLITRWVGFESLSAVVDYPEKGWDLWKTAWSEENKKSGTSFFDIHIIKSAYINDPIIDKVHFISLPGIIAFLYYPGSLIFLFFSVFVVGLLGSFIEILAYKASSANMIFSSLIAH